MKSVMRNDFYVNPCVSKKALNAFLSHFSAGADELHTLEIYENNALLVRMSSSPYRCTDKREIYSLSKSFCSTAIGFLIDEGRLSEEDRIIDLFPDKLPEMISENLAKMRVCHVLSMNTGHEACVLPVMLRAEDAAEAFLAQPVLYEPGTHFVYNNGGTCMLSCIVQKITGMSLLDFLSCKLFMPLGIDGVSWTAINDGTNLGAASLHVSCDDIAKLGLLYLNHGIWKGQRLLSEYWIEKATSPISDNSANGNPDWRAGYGYQFWCNAREGFRGDGSGGQLCFVLPERKMVFALQTRLGNMQEEIDGLYELAAHIHDTDDEPVSVIMPQYAPVYSIQKTTGLEHVWYHLEQNRMGFTGAALAYDEKEDVMRLTLSNGVDQYVLCAGNGRWVESTIYAAALKLKRVDVLSADMAEHCQMVASYEAENRKLTLYCRYLNSPHHMYVTITGEEERLHVHFEARGMMYKNACDIVGTAMH